MRFSPGDSSSRDASLRRACSHSSGSSSSSGGSGDEPAALDGTQSGEVATVAVQGVDALDAYFARFVPQLVLAVVVPLAVIAWVVPIDLTSAVLMLLTLPLVPVFMVLIGRYTERETHARWRALALLSTHFLDVVRGLPDAPGVQSRTRADRGDRRNERAVPQHDDEDAPRRVSLGGRPRARGDARDRARRRHRGRATRRRRDRVRGALTILVLAPELYLPLRNLGAQYHASADGLAVAERLLELTEGAHDL